MSLAINREFLVRQETEGVGKVWGNWISPENRDALKGDGKDLPVPEFNVEKARQLLAQAGFPNGFEFEWFVPFVPYFDMGERILTDLRAVGIRGKLQSLEGPAFRSKIGQGRKGFPGNRTIVQNIDPRPGGAKAGVGIYAICGSPSRWFPSFPLSDLIIHLCLNAPPRQALVTRFKSAVPKRINRSYFENSRKAEGPLNRLPSASLLPVLISAAGKSMNHARPRDI